MKSNGLLAAISYWFKWVGFGFILGYLAIDLGRAGFVPSRATWVFCELVVMAWSTWRLLGKSQSVLRVGRTTFWWCAGFLAASIVRDASSVYSPGWRECVVLATTISAIWFSMVIRIVAEERRPRSLMVVPRSSSVL